jgi:NAD(P)-dependent dehydrogenase (short-subunit alcohol dehydrogenase family)
VSARAGPLDGRLALVTGASRGIGLAIARSLGAAGAHVVRLARSLADRSTERETDMRCDITDAGQVDRAVARVLQARGIPDVVVNNAGLFFVKPLAETSAEEFAGSVAVNLAAPFAIVRALLPHMIRRGTGHFVTIGSVADHVGLPGSGAYAATKFGLRGLHEVLASEVAGSGVRASLVSPGPVDTEMWDAVDPDSRPGFTKRARMMKPDDVAEAVLFVVTRPERAHVTELRLMPAAS